MSNEECLLPSISTNINYYIDNQKIIYINNNIGINDVDMSEEVGPPGYITTRLIDSYPVLCPRVNFIETLLYFTMDFCKYANN